MLQYTYTEQGNKYTLNGKSLVMRNLLITKEGASYTDKQIGSIIKNFQKFRQNIFNVKEVDFEYEFDELTNLSSNYNGPFYKFISAATYENFIKHGKFQLGSLLYYREIEREESRDDQEGFANLVLRTENRQIVTGVISGYNQYILCGTHNLNLSEKMSENFGDYVLVIKNISAFAEKINREIGAINWNIQKVSYSDYKCYKSDILIEDINAFQAFNEETFSTLCSAAEIPSIYCKPSSFKDEQELRLTFEMKSDVAKTLNFLNIELLDDIEVIQIPNN